MLWVQLHLLLVVVAEVDGAVVAAVDGVVAAGDVTDVHVQTRGPHIAHISQV